MGILNITGNSFYSQSRYQKTADILKAADKMLEDGATFIDIGAQSTRPGADEIGIEAELKAVIPAIEILVKQFTDILISIDTYHAKVARCAIEAGASLINDVSAGDDDAEMLQTVIDLKVPYIMMHKKGTPKTMQQNPIYDEVVLEIINYFIPKIEYLQKSGLPDIIIDPGFGFGKTLNHNYEILSLLENFKILELPMLVGVSRKSMIQKVIEQDAANALNGTTVANTIALLKGAKILRVHDVKEAKECIKITTMIN